jgi:hypothetical protein
MEIDYYILSYVEDYFFDKYFVHLKFGHNPTF